MGRRHALLVATTRYSDPKLPDLPDFAPHAQQRLAQLLLDPEVGAFDSARVLLNQHKAVIEYEIEKMVGTCSPDDLVLLHISGHGFRSAVGMAPTPRV